MGWRFRRRSAIILYIVFAVFVMVGFAVSPLTAPPHPPVVPSGEGSGIAVFGMTLPSAGGSSTFSNALTVSSFPFNASVMAMKPVKTTILVAFNVEGKNLTRLISINSVSLEIDNAVFVATGKPAVLNLNVSTNSQENWGASGIADIEYTQGGPWTGTLTTAGILSDGTSTTLSSPVSASGFTVGGPVPISYALSNWSESIAIWVVGTIVFFGGIFSIKEPFRKRFGRRH